MPAELPSTTIQIRFAWWVRPYLAALGFVCRLLDMEPDVERISRVVLRGVIAEHIKSK